MNLDKRRTFCCPIDEDVYFIPKCSDERDDSPKFPSPTGCLTREETEELERCMNEANELLLSLGLSGEIGIDRSYFLALQDDLGADLRMDLECNKQKEQRGKLIFVGRNFLILEELGEVHIVPYQNISKVAIEKKSDIRDHTRYNKIDELLQNPFLKRDLVLNFGATVSQSPVLIHEFFGLTLSVLLITYIDQKVTVFTEGDTITGLITEVDSETISMMSKNRCVVVPLVNICKIDTMI